MSTVISGFWGRLFLSDQSISTQRWSVRHCGGGDEATAAKLKGLPIWCFHGDADNAVPVERSRTMVEAVKAAGGTVQYTEYKGLGHDSWTPAYRDPATLDWLFGQKR
jgi:predicted peptidase